MKRDFQKPSTEQRNPRSRKLDTLSIPAILDLMDREEGEVLRAVKSQKTKIAAGARLLEKTLRAGRKIYFIGAGTSGRLAVIEASEMPPTFDTPPDLIQAVIAGGPRAVWSSQEGAEDDEVDGANQIRARVRRGDTVVGIAASGVTPFVHGALREAKKRRAETIFVTCNRKGLPKGIAKVVISTVVGPEVITGSTRLKAGTATKMVLNRLTVAAMVRFGKVFENFMVDLQPKSQKLYERAIRIIQYLSGAERFEAEQAMRESGNRAKVAVVMLVKHVERSDALRLLSKAKGQLRKAIR